MTLVDVSARPGSEGAARAAAAAAAEGVTVVRSDELLASHAASTPAEVAALPRGEGVAVMSAALGAWLRDADCTGGVGAAIGLGGSGNTALVASAMRAALPVGVPKLMVSTMAAGDVSPYVQESDVIMAPSVVDVAGLNSVSRAVLGNAAAAAAGMAAARKRAHASGQLSRKDTRKPTIGLSMFGVTTTAADAIRARLEAEIGAEVLVFHATGAGGRCMEGLAAAGLLQGVVDLTTTEIVDHLHGGVLSAGPGRLDALIRANIPLVVSTGALDMVNYGARDTVPEGRSGRQLFEHNSEVTLMRTTPDEAAAAASFIASKLNTSTSPWAVVVPAGGVSALDAPGQSFYDPEATKAIQKALQAELEVGEDSGRELLLVDAHINDASFADAVVDAFCQQWVARSHACAEDTSAHDHAAAAPAHEADPPVSDTSDSPPLTEVLDAWPTAAGEVANRLQPKRQAILAHLRKMATDGEPIIGAGAGTGLSAKAAAAGGASMVVIYNSGKFRMAGRGSLAGLLPYADANAVLLELAKEVAPVLKGTGVPLLAGVNGTDPFRNMLEFLIRLPDHGFVGVQNFPTVGLMDGKFRQNLEETGMGFQLEVDMISMASSLGLVTTPYVFTPEEARKMALAGADVVIAHVGLTSGGAIGAESVLTIEQAADSVAEMARAVRDVGRDDALVLCHGGPIAEPEDAAFVLRHCGGEVAGFFGASSMERLPTELAIAETVRKFKATKVK